MESTLIKRWQSGIPVGDILPWETQGRSNGSLLQLSAAGLSAVIQDSRARGEAGEPRRFRPGKLDVSLCQSMHQDSLEFFVLILCVWSRFNRVWLCDPMDCGPPGSSVHGVLQARTLERVAMPSSRGSSWPRNRTHVSCITGGFFTAEPPEKLILQ